MDRPAAETVAATESHRTSQEQYSKRRGQERLKNTELSLLSPSS